jgi:2-keto-4-pentenoate hydratase/2-oxohepta-3-ene-1,7-dioic acid hydratase in catechol pathway
MVFSVKFLVAELSRGMTLLAGTIVLTGTPAGVGAGRTPPLYLKDGDTIEVKIGKVGHLVNKVREA